MYIIICRLNLVVSLVLYFASSGNSIPLQINEEIMLLDNDLNSRYVRKLLINFDLVAKISKVEAKNGIFQNTNIFLGFKSMMSNQIKMTKEKSICVQLLEFLPKNVNLIFLKQYVILVT